MSSSAGRVRVRAGKRNIAEGSPRDVAMFETRGGARAQAWAQGEVGAVRQWIGVTAPPHREGGPGITITILGSVWRPATR